MDQPAKLGDNERFNEFTLRDALRLAHGDQGLVHIGVELRADVLAVEAHACARIPFCSCLMVS